MLSQGESLILSMNDDEEDDLNRIPLYEIKDFSRRFKKIKEEYLREKEKEGKLKKDSSVKSMDLTEIAFKDILMSTSAEPLPTTRRHLIIS